MAVRAAVGSVTFGEFMETIREDQKADLIQGVIYMASPETLEHNDLVLWLATVIRLFVRRRRLGRVTINRLAYRLRPKEGPEPDVAFVAAARQNIVKKGYVAGPPDLAIEVVSPDSIDRDYVAKRAQYESSGVREYWIIDLLEQTATFLVLENGAFVESQPKDGVFRSRVLPGFALNVEWLWQDPLPDEMDTVKRLLAGGRRR